MTIAIASTGFARVAGWMFAAAAGAAGAWYSFGFGVQIGGVAMGFVAAANGAAMASLLASAVLDRLWPRVQQ
jgi:hypothetical protein